MIFQFSPDKGGLQKFLGPLEAQIMTALWDQQHYPASAKAIHKALLQERQIAYTTINTTMDRLVRKGMVQRDKQGSAFGYRPAYPSESEFLEAAISHILVSLHEFDGRVSFGMEVVA